MSEKRVEILGQNIRGKRNGVYETHWGIGVISSVGGLRLEDGGRWAEEDLDWPIGFLAKGEVVDRLVCGAKGRLYVLRRKAEPLSRWEVVRELEAEDNPAGVVVKKGGEWLVWGGWGFQVLDPERRGRVVREWLLGEERLVCVSECGGIGGGGDGEVWNLDKIERLGVLPSGVEWVVKGEEWVFAVSGGRVWALKQGLTKEGPSVKSAVGLWGSAGGVWVAGSGPSLFFWRVEWGAESSEFPLGDVLAEDNGVAMAINAVLFRPNRLLLSDTEGRLCSVELPSELPLNLPPPKRTSINVFKDKVAKPFGEWVQIPPLNTSTPQALSPSNEIVLSITPTETASLIERLFYISESPTGDQISFSNPSTAHLLHLQTTPASLIAHSPDARALCDLATLSDRPVLSYRLPSLPAILCPQLREAAKRIKAPFDTAVAEAISSQSLARDLRRRAGDLLSIDMYKDFANTLGDASDASDNCLKNFELARGLRKRLRAEALSGWGVEALRGVLGQQEAAKLKKMEEEGLFEPLIAKIEHTFKTE